jgi:hypothetical protein|tara:strand:- start:52 stop:339 length:288 start_codon:yes stop_codon:yes gene_type:complete
MAIYQNIKGIENFIGRGEKFPRVKIDIDGNKVTIETKTVQQGYAWIGLAHHNKDNGCKAVESINYLLIQPNYLTITFREADQNLRSTQYCKVLSY